MKTPKLAPIVFAAAWLFVGCSQDAPTTSVETSDPTAGKPVVSSDDEYRSGGLAAKLGLSEAQQTALKALRAGQKAETQAVLKAASESKDREALRDQLKALREKHHAAFLGLLTDEQRAAYAEMRAEAKKRAQQRKTRAKTRRTPVEDQLGLDADQRTAVKALREELRTDSKAVAKEARKTKADRETVKQQLEVLRSAFDKAFREILTDEQEAKYDQIVAGRKTQRKAE